MKEQKMIAINLGDPEELKLTINSYMHDDWVITSYNICFLRGNSYPGYIVILLERSEMKTVKQKLVTTCLEDGDDLESKMDKYIQSGWQISSYQVCPGTVVVLLEK